MEQANAGEVSPVARWQTLPIEHKMGSRSGTGRAALLRLNRSGLEARAPRKPTLAQGFHAAGFMAVLRSSFRKDRMKIPTMYVTLSNVSAVAKPVLSMR